MAAKLIDIANAMFKKKSDWEKLTDEDKELNFFIFNRYFSKKFPEKSQLLNQKGIDKVTGMNLWYYFMLDKPYPNWFWSKSEDESISEESIISDKDFSFLLERLKLDEFNLNSLIKYYPDLIEEELKYLKDIDKASKK